jgi:hypothetical protein
MTTLTFRVTAAEARRIRGEARREKLTLSEFLRRRAGGKTAGSEKPGRILCPLTGAMVFAPMAGHPPLTLEAVRDIMADFP